MTAPTRTRRRREVLTKSDGTTVTITKSPRADVLWYPRYHWATVLVRRTHDLDTARALAEQRWAEIGDERPLTASRIGWWQTYASKAGPPASAAEDQIGRVVAWCDDTARAAGPGIEFRP